MSSREAPVPTNWTGEEREEGWEMGIQAQQSGEDIVSCPAHMHLPARNGLVNEVEFLGLITQKR